VAGPDQTVLSHLGDDTSPLVGGFLLALLIAFLVPFPGTLFSKTVEANHEEIVSWFARPRHVWQGLVRATHLPGAVTARLSSWLTGTPGVWLFVLLSAVVYGFLDPRFGLADSSLPEYLGILAGLALITVSFDLPLRLYRRHVNGDGGFLKSLWWTLPAAIVCVVISRVAGFQPGYLYGLIVSALFTTEVARRHEGIGIWLASAVLFVVSIGAWLALSAARGLSLDPNLATLLQTALACYVVAGIETLAVGLLPMRFLPGRPVYEWSRAAWLPIFLISVMAYLLVLVNPRSGYLSDDSRTPMIIGVCFLAAFGIVSMGTWAYFRFRPGRHEGGGGEHSGEAAATAFREPDG
jgi:hypothetical protein